MSTTIRLAVAATALSALSALPLTAHAYERLTRSGCPNGFKWASDPQFSFNPDGVPAAEEADYRATAELVMERVNLVAGTWLDLTLPLGTASTADDMSQNGINEVGMTELDHDADGFTMGWGPSYVDTSNCTIAEADLHLTNWTDLTWEWGLPADQGVNYWEAENSVGMTYFARPILLHELGHTYGLAHSDTSYSFMNYKTRPWSNRDDDKRVEPLADDREALRAIYPGSADESDIAVLTTWYDPSQLSNGAATAFHLCAPSKGSAWSSSIFDETCGVEPDGSNGSVEVCPGDDLRVRYAVTNYGTDTLDAEVELWFSENDWLNRDAGFDLQSPDVVALTASPQSSYRKGNRFDVPAGLTWNQDYYVMIHLNTGADLAGEESQQNNWIPMVGQIHVKSMIDCVDLHVRGF
jgi:hypothetical protein